MKNKELIKNVPSSEKVLEWNAKETVAGAEQKANAALEQAKQYADENKVAKITGKQLSTEDFTTEEKNKLAGLNNYVHPEKHNVSEIATNMSARFVSDNQISYWNGKETPMGSQLKADKALSDAKTYVQQETNKINDTKLDSVELQNKELLFKANNVEKFRITIPASLDKLPIASNTVLGGIKIGAGLAITPDGILSTTGTGVADSVMWENVVGKPDRFVPMEHTHQIATTTIDGFMSKTDKTKLNELKNYTHPATHPASVIDCDTGHRFVTDMQIANFNDKYTKAETNNLINTKFDNVDSSGNTLRFFSNGIQQKTVTIPATDFNDIINKPLTYKPPVASKYVLGGIKVGNGLSVSGDGTLSVDGTAGGGGDVAAPRPQLLTKKMTVNIFNYDNASKMYKARVSHNLNSESIIITAFDSASKESIILSYKTIDVNTIEIGLIKQFESVDLLIIGGEFMAAVEQPVVNDAAIALDTTWSSQKINDELQKYNTLPGQVRSVSEKVDGMDLTVKQQANSIRTLESKDTQNIQTFSLLRNDVDSKVARTALSTPGGCEIDGSNIKANTLSVDLIKSNNENPIIRLFDQCAIDATASMNQGKGDAIRLKWSNDDYIRISSDSTKFYNKGVCSLSIGNTTHPYISLFGKASIDATAYMNQGVGDAVRLKWDDNNYMKISADSIAFYGNGRSTMSIGTELNPIISLFGGKGSIDAEGYSIRYRYNNNNYLRISEGESRFYINGNTVVKITSSGIVQGVPVAAVNEIPQTMSITGQQTRFSEFVSNDFSNAVGINTDGKLVFDTAKITTPEMKSMILEEDGSYSYSSCIALLVLALKEEINARKALESKITV